MKKIFSLLLICLLSLTLCSCLDKIASERDDKYDVKKTEDFEYNLVHNNDTDEWDRYAIGDVFSEKEAVFIPQLIDGIPVEKLGFSLLSGTRDLHTFHSGRLYLPNTISLIVSHYARTAGVKIFFCGDPRDLSFLFWRIKESDNHIYVPYDEYQSFCQVYGIVKDVIYLEKANVSYYLNYPDGIYEYNKYYYIDYYENGELIEFIPPIPEKEGYAFGGWYKEAECINEWNFELDTIIFNEEHPVTNLYAKWILVD